MKIIIITLLMFTSIFASSNLNDNIIRVTNLNNKIIYVNIDKINYVFISSFDNVRLKMSGKSCYITLNRSYKMEEVLKLIKWKK